VSGKSSGTYRPAACATAAGRSSIRGRPGLTMPAGAARPARGSRSIHVGRRGESSPPSGEGNGERRGEPTGRCACGGKTFSSRPGEACSAPSRPLVSLTGSPPARLRPGRGSSSVSRDRTPETGHPRQDTRDRTPETGHPRQDPPREHFLYDFKGGSLRSPPAPGCGRSLRSRPRRRRGPLRRPRAAGTALRRSQTLRKFTERAS